jgi:hypothetical protein
MELVERRGACRGSLGIFDLDALRFCEELRVEPHLAIGAVPIDFAGVGGADVNLQQELGQAAQTSGAATKVELGALAVMTAPASLTCQELHTTDLLPQPRRTNAGCDCGFRFENDPAMRCKGLSARKATGRESSTLPPSSVMT